MTKREKIAALLRMTVDRGCTAAEAETARRLAAKLQAERAPIETIARRFDPPVTMDLHRSRGPRTNAAGTEVPSLDQQFGVSSADQGGGKIQWHSYSLPSAACL